MAAVPSAFKPSLGYLPLPIFTPSNPSLLASPSQQINGIGPLQLASSIGSLPPPHQLSTLPPSTSTTLSTSADTSVHQSHPAESIFNSHHQHFSMTNCSNTSSSDSHLKDTRNMSIYSAKQLSKLKRFLTTLRQFGSDISPEVGEKVRGLILDLVNAVFSVDEFQHKLQDVTNFPIRHFIAPFLQSTIPLLRQELSECAQLSIRPPIPPLNSIYSTPSATPYYHHHSSSSPFDFYPKNWQNPPNDCKLMMYGQTMSTSAYSDLKRKDRDEYLFDTLKMDNYRKKGKRDSQDNLKLDQSNKKSPIAVSKIYDNDKTDSVNPSATIHEPKKSITTADEDIHEIQILKTVLKKEINGAEVRELGDFVQSIKGAVRKVEGMLTTLNQQSTKTDPTDSKLIKSNQDRRQNNGHQEQQSDQPSRSESLISEKSVEETDHSRNSAFSPVKNQSGCWYCGKKANETCGGCKIARYCSINCQHKDWNIRHHVICWQLLTYHSKTDPKCAIDDTCYKDARLEPRCSKEIAVQNLKSNSGKTRKS